MTRRTIVAALGLLLGASSLASAQTVRWRDQTFVNLDFGAQSKGTTDATHFGFGLFDEQASIDVTQKVKGSSYFDVTAGTTPFGGRYGVAVHFMQRATNNDGTLSASLPDPAYYDTPSTFSGTIPALQHRESWFGALAAVRLLGIEKLELMALGGPAVVHVRHEVVTDVVVDASTGQVTANLSILSRNLIGYEAGIDARYGLMRLLGVGGFVRFVSAKGHLGPDLTQNLGGLQYGAGVQVRF